MGWRGYSQNPNSFRILVQSCDESKSYIGGKKISPAVTGDI